MGFTAYSQGPSNKQLMDTYIPLPVDFIVNQMERKQKSHDTTKAYLGAIEDDMLKVQSLSPDQERVKQIRGEYEQGIGQGIEDVKGDYSRLGGLADITARKLKKDMSIGELGAIHRNALAAAQHKETLDKMRESGRIGDRGYSVGLNSISDFSGTKEIAPGQYSSAQFYTPVKEASIPETAQKYARANAVQYDSLGRKYISANTVERNTFTDLLNDETMVSNAKEDIKYRYGKQSPEKEATLVANYLKNMARNAGNEVKFQEQYKPETSGTGSLDNTPEAYTYSAESANPSKSGLSGKVQLLKDVLNTTKQDIARTIASKRSGIGGMSPGFNAEEQVSDEAKRALVEDKANATYKGSIKGTPVLYDRLKTLGIDPDNSTEDQLEKGLEQIKAADESSRNIRVVSNTSDIEKKNLQSRLDNKDAFLNSNIQASDGTQLSRKDKEKLFDSNKLAEEKGRTPIYPGGVVRGEGTPQAFPEGTRVFNSAALGGDGSYRILPFEVNDPAYHQDRMRYAMISPNGYSGWQDGRDKIEIQKVLLPGTEDRFVIRKYINGEPEQYKDSSGKKEDMFYYKNQQGEFKAIK